MSEPEKPRCMWLYEDCQCPRFATQEHPSLLHSGLVMWQLCDEHVTAAIAMLDGISPLTDDQKRKAWSYINPKLDLQ